jgi:hypothetical protein
LAAKMRWLIQNRTMLAGMSSAARAAAEGARWANYRRQFRIAIEEIMIDR